MKIFLGDFKTKIRKTGSFRPTIRKENLHKSVLW